jgi:EAL domain-containing protein (putative c-di-GMP-specific phosphodiesterase class I)
VRTLDEDEMQVLFQPIVDLRDGAPWAYEALARCHRPHFRDPSRLFSAAVEQGATGRLGRVIRQVTFGRAPDAPIFVNIHPHELSSRWLVRADDPLGFHRRGVYLEITETAAFEYFDLCRSVLQEVCDRTGAHLVVDDLGAGHSNLARVLELEPKVVKLDRALVQGIDSNRRKRLMVKHVTALCLDLGAQVVAEGLETASEVAATRDVGVPYGQGYFMASPAEKPPLIQWPFPPP